MNHVDVNSSGLLPKMRQWGDAIMNVAQPCMASSGRLHYPSKPRIIPLLGIQRKNFNNNLQIRCSVDDVEFSQTAHWIRWLRAVVVVQPALVQGCNSHVGRRGGGSQYDTPDCSRCSGEWIGPLLGSTCVHTFYHAGGFNGDASLDCKTLGGGCWVHPVHM